MSFWRVEVDVLHQVQELTINPIPHDSCIKNIEVEKLGYFDRTRLFHDDNCFPFISRAICIIECNGKPDALLDVCNMFSDFDNGRNGEYVCVHADVKLISANGELLDPPIYAWRVKCRALFKKPNWISDGEAWQNHTMEIFGLYASNHVCLLGEYIAQEKFEGGTFCIHDIDLKSNVLEKEVDECFLECTIQSSYSPTVKNLAAFVENAIGEPKFDAVRINGVAPFPSIPEKRFSRVSFQETKDEDERQQNTRNELSNWYCSLRSYEVIQ